MIKAIPYLRRHLLYGRHKRIEDILLRLSNLILDDSISVQELE